MDVTYTLRKDIVFDEEQQQFTVYGITAKNEAGEVVAKISDIFFDKDKAEEFVDMCNREKLELADLQEKAEDQLI